MAVSTSKHPVKKHHTGSKRTYYSRKPHRSSHTHSSRRRGWIDRSDSRQSELEFLAERNRASFALNDLHFYGLAPSNMDILSSNPKDYVHPPYVERAYRFMQSAYYGVKQSSIEGRGYAVPHEVLITLHPSEILALNCAINKIKFDGGIKYNGTVKDISLVTIDDIVDLTDKVIDKALSKRDGFTGFRKMYYSKNKDIHEMPLRERITNLPSEALAELLLIARTPYRNVYEPHPENVPSWSGVETYKNQIGSIMMAAWTKNMDRVR